MPTPTVLDRIFDAFCDAVADRLAGRGSAAPARRQRKRKEPEGTPQDPTDSSETGAATPTVDAVREGLRRYAQEHGRDAAIGKLEALGAKTVNQLDEAKFGELLTSLE